MIKTAMPTSPHSFAVRMYDEHLEEASFLYEQRKALLRDPEIPWTRIGEFEERLEAHIDALVIGGRLALDIYQKHAKEGDAGELFSAVSVYCRHQDAQLLAETWRVLDYDDPAKTVAVTDALKYELPTAWYPAVQRAIERGDERQVPLLARVCGYRRAPCGEQLVRRSASNATVISASVLSALSRIAQGDAAESILQKCCNHADPAIRTEAYLGLVRMGRREVLRECLTLSRSEEHTSELQSRLHL